MVKNKINLTKEQIELLDRADKIVYSGIFPEGKGMNRIAWIVWEEIKLKLMREYYGKKW